MFLMETELSYESSVGRAVSTAPWADRRQINSLFPVSKFEDNVADVGLIPAEQITQRASRLLARAPQDRGGGTGIARSLPVPDR